MVSFGWSRLRQAAVTLLLISVLAFAVPRLVPGDPAQLALGPLATPASLAQLRAQMGLDNPPVQQYFNFIFGALHLDFGVSLRSGQSATSTIAASLGPSLLLVGMALVFATTLAIPLGVLAAVRHNRTADHVVRLVGTVCYALPSFLVGLALILVFSVNFPLFPVQGYGDSLSAHVWSLVLPASTLALALSPLFIRTLRAAMLHSLSQDYVEAARARGLSSRRVVARHALRNSLLPTVTLIGLSVGASLSLSVVVENVFSIPGLGSLLVQSVNYRDYPVIQGLIVTFAVLVLISSFITDLTYRALDPRIQS